MLVLLVLLFCVLPCKVYAEDAAKGQMPIIAFFGIPGWHTTEEHFRTFSECGFNVSLSPYPSLDILIKACRYADKYGVKILGRCPEMTSNPTLAARKLLQEKGFFGYYLQDEPSVPEMHERQREIEKLKLIDSTHTFYINLFPCYNPDWIPPSTKAINYPAYLKTLSATDCQQLSFDFYPITTKGIRPTWYHNLEMVRQESLACSKPFWGFVLSVPHNVPLEEGNYYPTPTLASLRLQVYSNLAYGAQAIQYFTYWTSTSGKYQYHDAPVDTEGHKTKTYNIVQQMNRELKRISSLFYGARVLSVHHLGGTLPEGTTRQTQMPQNLRSLKVVSKKGAILSEFMKDGHYYFAIVNKDHENSMTVRLRYRNTTPRQITKLLKENVPKTSYSVEPGDILLFILK